MSTFAELMSQSGLDSALLEEHRRHPNRVRRDVEESHIRRKVVEFGRAPRRRQGPSAEVGSITLEEARGSVGSGQ